MRVGAVDRVVMPAMFAMRVILFMPMVMILVVPVPMVVIMPVRVIVSMVVMIVVVMIVVVMPMIVMPIMPGIAKGHALAGRQQRRALYIKKRDDPRTRGQGLGGPVERRRKSRANGNHHIRPLKRCGFGRAQTVMVW